MKTKLKTTRLVLAPFGIAFFALGLGATYYLWFPDSYGEKEAGEIEFPLGDVNSIAVDSNGRIFCAQPAYSRVQAYDSTGGFLWGWFPEVEGRDFMLGLRQEDILILVQGGEEVLTYSARGQLLERSRVDLGLRAFFKPGLPDDGFRTQDADYRIRRRGLGRSIERVRGGHAETVVQPSVGQWLVQSPFPGLVFLGLGPALLFFVVDPWPQLEVFRRLRVGFKTTKPPTKPFRS